MKAQGDPPRGSGVGDAAVSFGEALRVWAKIGLLGFGGPAGQIALMHRVLVDEKRWIDEGRFLHALNYCMLLPGPEAQQLATYVGWLLHRTAGGIVAGTLFVLPGYVAIMALSVLYAGFHEIGLVQALFFGVKPAVLAIVVHAVVRIGRRALRNRALAGLAAAAFVGIFFFDLPFPLIVLGAAAIGFLGSRLDPRAFAVAAGHGAGADAGGMPDPARPSLARAAGVLVLWSGLWLGPLALLAAIVGPADVFAQIAAFFSKMAVVTFGGAYAVLAYVAQEAVGHYGWLRPGEMLDGLGLAETTPGPLIMVVQFVGFLAAYRAPGPFDPMLAGVLGATLTVWVTFTPCFLWIFLGAPYVEALRGNRPLNAALGAITAAVVGVILNLAAWFALHTVFHRVDEIRTLGLRLWVPDLASLDVAALLLALGALVAMFRFGLGMMPTLAGSAAAGALLYLLA